MLRWCSVSAQCVTPPAEIHVLGQLPPAQLRLDDALQPSSLRAVGLDAPLRGGRLGELLTANSGIFGGFMTVSEILLCKKRPLLTPFWTST